MSDPSTAAPAPSQTDTAAELRLRGAPPRVVRLSRKALALMGGGAGIVIGGLLIYALQTADPQRERELYATEARPGADALADAPRDYSQAPRLGQPLPGDLGRPILDAQQRGQDVQPPPIGPGQGTNPADPAEAERETARLSQLFMASTTGRRGEGSILSGLPGIIGGQAPAMPQRGDGISLLGEGLSQSGEAARDGGAGSAFLSRASGREPVSAQRLAAPASPYIVQAGSVIRAALITGIRSDLPGQITAQVTENVYDSPTGRFLLIPQGARLIGEYDSQVAFGQRRVLLAWDRLILPDGRSIALARQPATDPSGYAGLQDRVNNHWGGMLRAALISTVLGVGAELGADDDDALVRALRRGTQDTINQTGQQVVRRELNVRPTLTIRPGFPLAIMVTQDLVLSPLRETR